MFISIQDVDYVKLKDIDYVLREDVCRSLFELRYQQKIISYGYDGQDPGHFLYNKERCYNRFKHHLTMAAKYNTSALATKIYVLLEEGAKAKIVYSQDCVVCYDQKASIIIEECSHHVLCMSCLKQILKNGNKKCPICRSYIEMYSHYDL